MIFDFQRLVFLSLCVIVLGCKKEGVNIGTFAIDSEVSRILFLKDLVDSEEVVLNTESFEGDLISYLKKNGIETNLTTNLEFGWLFPEGELHDTWGNKYQISIKNGVVEIFSKGSDGLSGIGSNITDDISSVDLRKAEKYYDDQLTQEFSK